MVFGDVKVGEVFRHISQTLIRVYGEHTDKSCVIIEPVERRGEWVVFNNKFAKVSKPTVPFSQIKIGGKFIYNGIEHLRTEYMYGWNCISGAGAHFLSDEKQVERV